jgi:glycosyltransferase involved in cell wall biosynthesis
VAISGRPPRRRLTSSGWRLRDGFEVSHDPWVYLDYLASSAAEFSVAKNAYVAARTGWFSTRTACYLALGVPAVVQDTGFGRRIPTGEGLLTFATLDEAADAIERVAGEPQRHARAARELALEYFNSDRVLEELIDRALSPTGGVAQAP